MSFGKYLQAAFVNRWNLLAFLGGMGFAALSPLPEALAALVMAGEVAYVGLLAGHPKFQAYVNARASAAASSNESQAADAALARILNALPKPALQRFQSLRNRCIELRQLASQIKSPGNETPSLPLEGFQIAGLDRLLWIYLRLLFTHYTLEQFLERTDQKQLERSIKSFEDQLARLAQQPDGPARDRARKTLEDSLQTSRQRLENLAKARENYNLLALEIQRLENKIQSLGELAINRQEPDYVSGQIDQVASSMADTERTMKELSFATGLDTVDEAVPSLVSRPAVVLTK